MAKLRILIADDEALIRLDIREILEEAGYEVVGEASNGAQAIELARVHQPDLVILDVKMPGVDGLEATKAVSALGYPVLLLTAHSHRQIIERAKKVGAISYLVKPVAERDIIPAVEMAYMMHRRLQALQQEVQDAQRAIAERKAIERACALYARKLGIDSGQAYRRLAQCAMKTNKTLYRVACDVLDLVDPRLSRRQDAGL